MKTLRTTLLVSIFGAIAIALTGCDTESTEQASIHISPNNARVRIHQSQEFVVTGFTDYTWSLSNNEIGVLSTTKGDRTVYTAVSSASNVVQVLTVSARVSITTNGAPLTTTAEALITHY
jgi:hypothetical protein